MRNLELNEVPNRPKWIYTKRSHHVLLYSVFLMRNPEFKDIPNRQNWIGTNEAEKVRFQRSPEQVQKDLHKKDALCVNGF